MIDPRSLSNVNFSMGNFDRPQHTTVTQLKLFIRYFSRKLTELNSNNTEFVCGDYNINLLLVDSDEHSGSYFDGILSSGFLPSITLHTRLSDNSTPIDNIFVKKQNSINITGIISNKIIDHQAVVVNINLTMPPSKTKFITIYSNSAESKINLKNDILSKRVCDEYMLYMYMLKVPYVYMLFQT